MKKNFPLVFLLFFFIVHKVRTGAIKAPLSIITLDDISEDERKHIDSYVQYERSKRSGSSSADLLGVLKTLLAQGAKAKLRLIGRASAAASSSLAGSSSSSNSAKSYPSYGYSYHPHPVDENDSKEVNLTETFTDIDRIDRRGYKEKPDPWWMKKAVLNTLLQAVKAIKGGVLALKGQLIKGGGYLLVGGGKLVKAKGEVITNLGKKIARTAFREMHSSEVHEDVSYGHYHPEVEYGPPSGPGPDHFHHIDYQGSYPDKKASGVQSGILILKKIPSGKNSHSSHHGAESTIHEYKAEEPSFGSIVSKLFSAASSSNPDSPVPFTDYRQTHPQPDDYPSEGASDDQHDKGNFDTDFELEPAFDSPEANKVIEPESSGEVDLGPHNLKVTQGDSHPPDPPSVDQNPPTLPAVDFKGLPQGPNFGTFINLAQDFDQLNPSTNSFKLQSNDLNHYTIGDFQNHGSNQASDLGGNFAEPPEHLAQNSAASFSNYQNFQQEPSKPSSANIFDHNFAEPPGGLLQYNLDAPQGSFQGLGLSAKFGSFEQLPSQLDKRDFSSNKNFLGPYNPEFLESQKGRRPQPPKRSYDKYRGQLNSTPKINKYLVDPSSNLDLPRFPPNHPESPKGNNNHNFPPFPKRPSGPHFRSPIPQQPPMYNRKKPPTSTKPRQVISQQSNNPFTRSKNQPRPPNFDIVQSVTYQLGPNGPTKL